MVIFVITVLIEKIQNYLRREIVLKKKFLKFCSIWKNLSYQINCSLYQNSERENKS